MPRADNTPQAALKKIPPEKVKMIVTDILTLHRMGKCETDEEVEARVEQYFEVCRNTSIRPGIETLCAALHIGRTTLWRWSQGERCSSQRTEIIQSALAMINSFLEQAQMAGQINPVSGIFLSKNWMGYKDSFVFEGQIARPQAQTLTPDQIRAAISGPTEDCAQVEEQEIILIEDQEESED